MPRDPSCAECWFAPAANAGAPDLQSGRLVEILTEYRIEQAGIYAMYPNHKQVSSNTLALIAHLQQWFQASLPT